MSFALKWILFLSCVWTFDHLRSFGGFALCVPTAWSLSCLPCEESVRALLSSGSLSCVWTFDHLRSFGGFALYVPTAWSLSCLPNEELVRALLSSDLVSVLCLDF